jgi:hypothetical protein
VQLPRTARIGLVIVTIGLLVPLAVAIWHATINFVPVYRPIAVTPGHLQQSFTPKFSALYVMEIEAERKLPHETLQCLLGLQDSGITAEQCRDIPPVLGFSWRLTRNGQTVSTGSSAKIDGGAYTDATVASEFGSFEGQRGAQYTLDMDFFQDASKLSVAQPKLRIGVSGSAYEDLIAVDLFSLAFGVLCCLIGGLMFFVSRSALRRQSKAAARSASKSAN